MIKQCQFDSFLISGSLMTNRLIVVPGVVMLAFWGLGIWGFLASGVVQPLIMFGYIGTSLGLGLGLYGTLPKKKKPIWPTGSKTIAPSANTSAR